MPALSLELFPPLQECPVTGSLVATIVDQGMSIIIA